MCQKFSNNFCSPAHDLLIDYLDRDLSVLRVERCQQLAKKYLPQFWNGRLFHLRPSERDSSREGELDIPDLEGTGMQLALATLGLHFLDTRAPPRNVKIQGMYSFREVRLKMCMAPSSRKRFAVARGHPGFIPGFSRWIHA